MILQRPGPFGGQNPQKKDKILENLWSTSTQGKN